MALFIMACSAGKYQGVQAAGVKYDSRQHRTLYREFFLNGGYCSHDALILSAEYGFLPLTAPVSDYDLLLDDDKAAHIAGSPRSRRTVRNHLADHTEVYLYGGERYRDVARKVLLAVGYTGQVIDVVGPNRGCCDHFSALQGVFYNMSADA